jgi:nucleotide-binding universal stress UspA family protein
MMERCSAEESVTGKILAGCVLLPVDFSENCRTALRSVKQIPGIRKIVLLHLIYNRYLGSETPVVNPDTEKAGIALEEMKSLIALPGVPVTTIVREIAGGEISDAISQVAREHEVSLIVMSRRGAGIIGSVLLGSVASDLVRYGEKPLLLIPPSAITNQDFAITPPSGFPAATPAGLFSHVMVCTDFSDPEIGTICLELLPWIGRASLFHAVSSGHSEQEVKERESEAEGRLAELKALFTRHGITADTRVATGGAAEEILAFSERENMSLILLKSRGKKSLITSLIGSTSAPVARNAKKPVLILKPPFR